MKLSPGAIAAAGWPSNGQDKMVGQGNAIQDVKYVYFSAFLKLLPTSRADIYNLISFAIWLLIESWYQETWEEIWRQEVKKKKKNGEVLFSPASSLFGLPLAQLLLGK